MISDFRHKIFMLALHDCFFRGLKPEIIDSKWLAGYFAPDLFKMYQMVQKDSPVLHECEIIQREKDEKLKMTDMETFQGYVYKLAENGLRTNLISRDQIVSDISNFFLNLKNKVMVRYRNGNNYVLTKYC